MYRDKDVRAMATGDQVKALVKSHADGDDPQFYAVAMQVAANAARKGHSKFAQELRDLVSELRQQSHSNAQLAPVVAITQPRGELASLMNVSYPDARFSDLVLSDDTREALDNILVEQRQKDKLARYGLTPTHRMLFTGPPGTGKTSSAKAIAGELKLPLFSIRLESVLTKFMGETAAKLRLVFDALSETRGVYFFDEVDALASERANSNDVGEIRRVLNSFLQFLEEDTSDSLIIAATNHPNLLDAAIFRRFDKFINFDIPDSDQRKYVIENCLALFDLSGILWAPLIESCKGLSHSDIVKGAESAAKRAVLFNESNILTDELVDELTKRSLIK